MRFSWGSAGVLVAAMGLAGLSLVVTERAAQACGGCFHPPPGENPTVVTDHRMILSVAKDQSTLYDQIKYSGSPASFAWVLPISGTVDVGLSSDIVFQTLDSTTQTSIVQPPMNCPPPTSCNGGGSSGGFGGASDSSRSPTAPGAADAGVSVTKREVVGPYETVQLKATDANALSNWLSMNGFVVPADIKPVVDKYVAEKFDFLALRLLPTKGIQDMRPVRVTTHGANAVLPLRMVAAGTGPMVGISLWVLGEGRYEPQNFPTFAIAEADLVWDWAQSRSNYTDLRAAKNTANNGRAWEVESSTVANRAQIVNQLQFAQMSYDPVKDAQGNVTKSETQVRDEDLATLFAGIPDSATRVTRLRADLSHAALDADLVMVAAKDQAPLPNVRQVTKELNEPMCPVYDGCQQVGSAPRSEAAAIMGNGGKSASCSVGGTGSAPLWLGAVAALVGPALLRARRRRRPNDPG